TQALEPWAARFAPAPIAAPAARRSGQSSRVRAFLKYKPLADRDCHAQRRFEAVNAHAFGPRLRVGGRSAPVSVPACAKPATMPPEALQPPRFHESPRPEALRGEPGPDHPACWPP